MIKDKEGDKCSPKDLANEILGDSLGRIADDWVDRNMDRIELMTEREIQLLNDQVMKQTIRCYRILGMEEVEREGEIVWERKTK